MQRTRSRWSTGWIAVLALGFAGASAGETPPNAIWTPISSRIIKMEVYIPKGRWVKVAVQEGEPARISDSSLNLAVALVPVLEGHQVKVHTFRVETLATGGERFHWLADMDASVGETTTAKLTPATGDNKETSVDLQLRVVSVTKAAATVGAGQKLTPGAAQNEHG